MHLPADLFTFRLKNSSKEFLSVWEQVVVSWGQKFTHTFQNDLAIFAIEASNYTLVLLSLQICKNLQPLNYIDKGCIIHILCLWKRFNEFIENVYDAFNLVKLQIFRVKCQVSGDPDEILCKLDWEELVSLDDGIYDLNDVEV